MFLSNHVCLQVCPDGFYEDTGTSKCLPCEDGCATCNGPAISQCDTCKNATNLTTFYKVINATVCSQFCPRGQFIDSSILYLCIACAPQCVTCSMHADNCTQIDGCARGYYYYTLNTSCIATCPDGYFANVLTSTCDLCIPGCITCFGGTLDKCYSCGDDQSTPPVPYYKKIAINTCTDVCPDGQYE